MTIKRLIGTLVLGAPAAAAFAPSAPFAPAPTGPATSARRLSPVDILGGGADPVVEPHALASSAHLLAELFRKVNPSEARGVFWFAFLAGSGGLGIGIVQIPRLWGELSAIRALRGQGPTEGGEEVKLGPLAALLYPAPTEKDLAKVLAKAPTPEAITARSTSANYFATKGYVVEGDFEEVLKGCNPLAIKAAFDALSGGKGGAVTPDDYNEKLGRWRGDGGAAAFAQDLQGASVTQLSSYGTLLFLIALVGDLIVETGINGFLD